MSRVVKLASADGTGSSSAGLSTADVTSLISTKGEWEYVDKYEVTTNISTFTIDGFDMSTYFGYKIIYESFDPNGQIYAYYRIRRAGGDFVNVNSYAMLRHGSSPSTSRGAGTSDIYFSSSDPWGDGANDRLNAEIEIYQPAGHDTYYGYSKSSQKTHGGYYSSHTEGNFIGYRGTDDVTGIALQSNWSSGKAYLYRKVRRA